FTLLELMAAIIIVSILVVTAAGYYRANLSKFEEPACISNLRGLHGAFSSWLADHENVWPQLPTDAFTESVGMATPMEQQFWLKTFEPYGLKQKNWTCPTLRRLVKLKQTSLNDTQIHYLPTLFDEVPARALRSSGTPWLMEIADAHGRGNLLVFMDGSVRPFKEIYSELLKKGKYNRR
ncbi:MAG TPA: prepilin-type N-terminal cleavage/methylation domain-containing protein, partial [Terrimicrobiaceae bacterium]